MGRKTSQSIIDGRTISNRFIMLLTLRTIVILFVIFLILQSLLAQGENVAPDSAENIEAGKRIYMKKCQYCHGANGEGDGPAAPFLAPPPRDLTRARYKIISTESGELPTDQDIFNVISNGIPDTSMPDWSSLNEKEKWQTVCYIKTLAERFAWYKEIKKVSKIVNIPNSPPLTKESIERGRNIYMKKLECWKCHGESGRGDGPSAVKLTDEWEHPVKVTNLTKPWKFKIGSTQKDIYRTIITGIAGTPMPAFLIGNTEEELWDLTNYVESLSIKNRPQKTTVLRPLFIPGNLTEDLEDPLWNRIEAREFPLFGQILLAPKMYTPSIDAIYVKSIYNDKEIAFLIEWDDANQSNPGTTEEGEVIYADALAIQFPSQIPKTPASPRPFFLMGNPTLPVNLWLWNSGSNTLKEANAEGVNRKKYQSKKNKDLKGKVAYTQGQYKLLVKRDLTTSDKTDDVQMEYNKFIPIAFFVWDGHNGETESKMAVSSWYYLTLEKKETGRNVFYSILAILFVIIAEIIFVKIIRRNVISKLSNL